VRFRVVILTLRDASAPVNDAGEAQETILVLQLGRKTANNLFALKQLYYMQQTYLFILM
jgi:hypothetical protein